MTLARGCDNYPAVLITGPGPCGQTLNYRHQAPVITAGRDLRLLPWPGPDHASQSPVPGLHDRAGQEIFWKRGNDNIHIFQLFWVLKRFRWQKICFHPTHLLLWTLNRMKSLVRHFTARVINVLVVSVLTGCEYPNISIRALAYTDKYIREGPGHSSRYIHTVRTTDTGHARIRRQHLDLGSRNLFFATQIFAFPVITHFISGPKTHQKRKEVKLARPIKGLGLLYPISNPAFHPYVIEWPNSPNSQIDF